MSFATLPMVEPEPGERIYYGGTEPRDPGRARCAQTDPAGALLDAGGFGRHAVSGFASSSAQRRGGVLMQSPSGSMNGRVAQVVRARP